MQMLKPTKEERNNECSCPRCCEIRGGAGKPRVTLPPMNIDEAILHRDHVAVVLRNGYCQLYNTEGKLVTTYSVNDAKFVRVSA